MTDALTPPRRGMPAPYSLEDSEEMKVLRADLAACQEQRQWQTTAHNACRDEIALLQAKLAACERELAIKYEEYRQKVAAFMASEDRLRAALNERGDEKYMARDAAKHLRLEVKAQRERADKAEKERDEWKSAAELNKGAYEPLQRLIHAKDASITDLNQRTERLERALKNLCTWILSAELLDHPTAPDGTLDAMDIFVKVTKIKAKDAQDALKEDK